MKYRCKDRKRIY